VEPTFEQRLLRGRAGDSSALDDLFARWRALLYLQANQALGSELLARVDPSDVVQEALGRAFADLAQFRGQSEGEWVAWLRAIVAHQAAQVRRHHHAGKRDAGRECPLPDGVPNRPDSTLDADEARQLAAAIEALPAPMHQVVVRRVFHNEPFEVVAAALGRSPGAARVLWTRALRRLRQALEPNA
jgi:RNA polymerase sigma-70 factor (ECF subfamily)